MKKRLPLIFIAIGAALLLCWAIRLRATNRACATPMPRRHRTAVQRFEVHSTDFFNVKFVLPVAPPARPKAANRLPCNFSLRILSDEDDVAEDLSFTVLHSEPFPYSGSTLESFNLGEPVLLSRGHYRVEVVNRADTPAFQAPGAELRLEPHTTIASTALTQLLLVAGILLLALGSSARLLRRGG